MAFRQLKRPVAPECASLTPCSAAPSPCLTSGPTFVTLRPTETHASASDSGQRPGGPKAVSYQLKSTLASILCETYCGEAQLDDGLMADR